MNQQMRSPYLAHFLRPFPYPEQPSENDQYDKYWGGFLFLPNVGHIELSGLRASRTGIAVSPLLLGMRVPLVLVRLHIGQRIRPMLAFSLEWIRRDSPALYLRDPPRDHISPGTFPHLRRDGPL